MTASTGRELLAAVCARPDDDEPRLALAESLRRRGDPRGDFIRAQCLLARPDVPPDEWRRLAELSSALEAAHAGEWTAALVEALGLEPTPNYRPFGFVRGFVESLRVPADVFAGAAARLFDAAPLLRRIDLARPREGSFDAALGRAIAGRSELAAVTGVRLFSLGLTDAAFLAFVDSPHLGRLTALDLGANELGPASVAALLAAPFAASLTTLELWRNRIGDAGAAHIAAAAAPALRALRLDENGVGPRGAVALAGSPRLAGVDDVQLGHDPVGDAGVCALVGGLPGLRKLGLHAVGLGLAGLRRMLALPELARIEALDLGGNELGDAGLAALADSPHTGGLVSLDLEGSSIGDAGLQALARARNLGELSELRLRYNRITDVGAAALAASTRLPALTDIDLAYNDITGADPFTRIGGANLVGQGMRDELR